MAAKTVLGAWLILSPWAIDYRGQMMATSNSILIGVALIAVTLGAIFVPLAWEEWNESALSLWLIASPWALGFATLRESMLTAVVSGIVIAALILWTLLTDKDYSARWCDRTAL